MPRGCSCDSSKNTSSGKHNCFHEPGIFNSGGTFERSRFSANFGTLKQGPASVLFSRFLRPNNSTAAALQLAAPILQQRRVSLQPHIKNETRIRKITKRHPAAR